MSAPKRRGVGADELREQMTEALLRDVGISERMSAPIVDAVMRCFAGQQPYFPSGERSYPLLQIRAALQAGRTVKQVCDEFRISRRQLHRLFPGGLPASESWWREGGRSQACK
ncbi:hypothetical protein EA661_12945 [Pseudoxanthomonas winnipegensis]|uniref:Mor transcription activator domain-containing protein n=1 Tax=Pseudoxanthomonas winnipegensis TaxID=2480810 RepID=A0A4Q8LEM6_9GAMM|nr:helix-turn-helix transcriptional regulator [Pseudoxanthomonas winnipegensis]TAA27656.1 hypothetical protein EA661_12945 [Pseudoxanthomonas winnipegensis]